jgi:starch phosphorylase
MNNPRSIAYFSMEIAVDAAVPTYSGGLGVLAGDTVRAAADLKVPLLAVTLLHRKGYFTQSLDDSGWQREAPTDWPVERFLTELPQRVAVRVEHRLVHLRAWRYAVRGLSGFVVPVYFLDADLPENAEWDRTLTHYLYGGDAYYRLCQEVLLGIGGVMMVRALGHEDIRRFHMNEGHASLLTLELLEENARREGRRAIRAEDIEAVKQQCIFTTHTPVPAGHDKFPMDLVGRVLGHRQGFLDLQDVFCAEVVGRVLEHDPAGADLKDLFRPENRLNLTYLALNLSHYVNGVAKRHAEVSRRLFARYQIDDITNGVHAGTWASPAFQRLFDTHIAGWRADNFSLRYAHGLPACEVWEAHQVCKQELLDHVNARTGAGFDPGVFTLGFARRATPYKRADLLLHNLERLQTIAARTGPIQIVFSGKAHPNDQGGKEIIQRILRQRHALGPGLRLVYLENYDMTLARLMTAGVDVWLNTPLPPMEASGTSGMKAALNGVPSLSILDGWWIEGCIEGATGWAIGERNVDTNPATAPDRTPADADSLYHKLETVVLPLFLGSRDGFIDVMRHAIALNGSFFNTHRMVQQYVLKAYLN